MRTDTGTQFISNDQYWQVLGLRVVYCSPVTVTGNLDSNIDG